MKHLHTAVFGGLYLDADLRRNLEDNTSIVLLPYAARSSVLVSASAVPEDSEHVIKRLPAISPRADCIIKSDLRRNWFDFICQHKPDILLIDLTAEWYRVMQNSSGGLFTASPEFRQYVKPLLKGKCHPLATEDIGEWRSSLCLLRKKLLTLDLLDKTIFVQLESPDVLANDSASHSGLFKNLKQKYEIVASVFSNQPILKHTIAKNDDCKTESANPFQFSKADHKAFAEELSITIDKLGDFKRENINEIPHSPVSKSSFERYIEKRITAQSSETVVAAVEKYLENRILSVQGFPDFPFSYPEIWTADPFHNRTWKWYVHQLVFLSWLVGYAYQRKSKNALCAAKDALKSWWDFALQNTENPDLWHDHGTALRARNILDFIIMLERDADDHSMDILLFSEILSFHQKKLIDPAFYSQYTNHGFDQALVLFEVSIYGIHYLDHGPASLHVAIQRLNDEITHAFAADGGHVENSPGYLVYGLKQALAAQGTVQQLLASSPGIGLERERYLSALDALSYSVRPDGKLPHIGDTADFVVKDFIRKDSSPQYQHFLHAISKGIRGKPPGTLSKVLPVSGWAMVRSSYSDWTTYRSSTHIVFKCGFLSTYHRQDDDLSFVLYGGEEDWFIDGGLYKHAPKDPFRVYVRSQNAHNLASPIGRRVSRILPPRQTAPAILEYSDDETVFRIHGRSYMFEGFESHRELAYDRVNSTISIHDNIVPRSSQAKEHIAASINEGRSTYRLRFIVPTDKIIDHGHHGEIIIKSKKNGSELVISSENDRRNVGKIEISTGTQNPISGAWQSTVSGKIEPAYAIDYIFSSKELNSKISIKTMFLQHTGAAKKK